MMKFADLILDEELEEIASACRSLGLDGEEAASILEAHARRPYLLALVLAHGGDVAVYVRSRLEIERGPRSW